MRKIYSKTFISISAVLVAGLPAHAQVNNGTVGEPGTIIVPSSSSSYNQQGFNLPTAPRSSGQDIVRGSGGISCQSAVGGNGPVFDMGIIGTNDIYSRDSTALYGRITVPLGKKPKRVDCTKLYDLEIQRLKMELQLMRAGGFGNFTDNKDARKVMMQASSKESSVEPKEETYVKPATKPLIIPEKASVEKPVAPAKPIKIASAQPAMQTFAGTYNDYKPQSARPRIYSSPPVYSNKTATKEAPQPAHFSSMKKVYLEKNGDPSSRRRKHDSLYLTQLGAFSTLSNSKKAWSQYKRQIPEHITDFNATVKPIKRDGKVLYLLRMGPFDRATSEKVCESIDGGCYALKL